MASTTATTTYAPWLDQLRQKVGSETNRLYDLGAPNFFPGDTVADFTPDQLTGQNLLRNQLLAQNGNTFSGTLQGANAANNALVGTNVWNLNTIPGYQAMRQGIVTDAGRNLAENWMPSVRQDALANGMFGGSRGSIGEALAAARSTDALTQNLGALDSNMFSQLLGAQQNAISRAPELADATLRPAQYLQNLGGLQQNQAQSEITGQRERYTYDQNKPWWLLDQLRNTASSTPSDTQVVQNSSDAKGPNIWQTLGGALTTAAGSGVFNPWLTPKPTP